MKRYSAAQARQNFATLLDAAEQGERVVIERHGTRFSLEAHRQRVRARKRPSIIEHVDPVVDAGSWSWDIGRTGLRFRALATRSTG
jgi:antitoxin (DNA-binding transcriptional repressor) of toxin-antitoxin stability system